MHMMNLARLNGEVHLFVVHTVCEPEIVHLLENVPHNIGEEEVQHVMHDSDDGECEQVHDECQEVGDGECEQVHDECQEVGDGECEVPVSEERAEGDDIVEGQIEVECDVGECERDDVVGGEIEVECDVGESERDDVDVHSWSCSGEDANVDCNVDVPSMDDLVDYSDVEDGINTENDRGLYDDNWESEELVSGGESDGEDDEEESYGKFVTFTMPKTMVDYKWDLDTYFANKQDILDAIKTYAVENGRNLSN
ncbi:hypothetical protein LR48_Vigan10g271500 [Vigna angularis]|uniref:Uncharacterized protein n=1 Tax=Phaseolus angularis TaxID=3914 RepID=A0A0L9VPD7_PHAAN|nr:hypothetical protein LR48_Vigan10g271500 [Vigna angularis]